MQFLPFFLLAAGVLVMLQPRTKRWQTRMTAYFRGNEQRIKQRANTFFLLGLAFVLAGFAYLFRLAG
ncbi:hypothetical protein [Brevibacillus sp. SAFN-007a]|uniref:hypothetical protein n=1 Tax=Brevibacillus sp. SAFN-007a TaxID=3436862 RepID=UPI003F8067BB